MIHEKTFYKDDHYEIDCFMYRLDNFCCRNHVTENFETGEFSFEFKRKYYRLLTRHPDFISEDPRIRVIFVRSLSQIPFVVTALKNNIQLDDNGNLINEEDRKKLILLMNAQKHQPPRKPRNFKKKRVAHTKKKY